MPITKHQKPTGKVWKRRSNKRKDFHRDYEQVYMLEGGKLVEKWKKKV
jgi:hypothetical protein